MFERAREMRDELLANEEWYTSKQVVERLGDPQGAADPDEYTRRLRDERLLLGVRFRKEYLHPASQFEPSGKVHPQMKEVLDVQVCTDANWSVAFWWFQPTGLLAGRRPADVFATDPEAVVAAAVGDFVRKDEEF